MSTAASSKWMVLCPVLLVAAAVSVLLALDLRSQRHVLRGHPIGKILRTERRVRYKPKGGFIWQEAQRGQPLFEGDLLIANEDASAEIEMDGGEKLHLQPGSSVVLDMEALRNPAVKGTVLIDGADGGERFLSDGDSTAANLDYRLLVPEENSEKFVEPRKGVSRYPLTFSWRSQNQEQKARAVQISSNHLFEGGEVIRAPIPGGQEVQVEVPQGRSYWRLIDEKGAPLSVYHEFIVRAVEPLVAESPSDRVVSWDNSLDFQWAVPSYNPTAEGLHWIEISADPAFKSLIQEKAIAGLSLRAEIQGIPEGTYYWRITSHYGELVLSSEARKFQVEKGHKLAVQLSGPREKAVAQLGVETPFYWQTNSDKARYRLEVQDSRGSKIKDIQTEATSALIRDLPPGNFRWRVSARLGELQAVSEWRELSVIRAGAITPINPKPGETIVVEQGGPIDFEWADSGERASVTYLLEIATDPSFCSIVAFKTTRSKHFAGAEFHLLPKHDYFYRVSALDSAGRGEEISEPVGFTYTLENGLPAPADLLPQTDAVCNPIRTHHPCTFSWSPVNGAFRYEIEFFKMEGGRDLASSLSDRPVLRSWVTETSFELKTLAEGIYFWQVRAFDIRNRPGATAPKQRFQITFGKRLTAPRVRSLEVQ